MARRLVPLAISLGFMLLLAVRLGLSFEALPPVVATHFDLAGKPNGFQAKTAFAETSLCLSVFLFALFAALPAIMARIPGRLINLPNKDYWLAPERRAATLARLGVMVDWLGTATVGLLAGVFELIIRANLEREPLGYQLWILLPGYHLFILFWIVTYLRTLQRPDGA